MLFRFEASSGPQPVLVRLDENEARAIGGIEYVYQPTDSPPVDLLVESPGGGLRGVDKRESLAVTIQTVNEPKPQTTAIGYR